MTEKATYKGDFHNLWFLSNEVFQLDDTYKLILKCMIQKKDAYKGTNEAEIVRYFGQSTAPYAQIKREAIHKRLYGTSKTMGLVESEYVFVKPEKRKRGGHQEKTFHLTVKGLLASLSTKIPLEKIYLFENYIRFISDIADDKRITSIIKQKIINDIHIFLLWHKINGIYLKQLVLRHEYITEFFNKPFLKDFIYFSSGLTDKQSTSIAKNYFVEYFALESCISLLYEKKIIPAYRDLIHFEGHGDVKIGNVREEDRFLIDLNSFITEWQFYIEALQTVGGKKTNEIFNAEHFDIIPRYRFDINGSEVQSKIIQIFKKSGVKIKFSRRNDVEFKTIK